MRLRQTAGGFPQSTHPWHTPVCPSRPCPALAHRKYLTLNPSSTFEFPIDRLQYLHRDAQSQPPKCLRKLEISRRYGKLTTVNLKSGGINLLTFFFATVHRDLPAEGCLLYVSTKEKRRSHPRDDDDIRRAFILNPDSDFFFFSITAARIKKNKGTQQIKFKVRCQRYLYTLVLKDSDKAEKLKQSLPPSMPRLPTRELFCESR